MKHLRTYLSLVLIVVFLLPCSGEAREPASSISASPPRANDLSSLPASAQLALNLTLGSEDATYHARRTERGYQAANPTQALEIGWSEAGMQVQSSGARWQVHLESWGYGLLGERLEPVSPQAEANRVEYQRAGVSEWYVNGPLGVEQGFTLAASPGENPKGEPLTLALAQSGELRAQQAGAGLALAAPDGTPVLLYSGLVARDAAGKELKAWAEVSAESVLLRVDDRQAQYPLVIDPLVQEGKLTSFEDADDRFGWAVAISGEGSIAIVGAYKDDIRTNTDQGAAYVFALRNGVWGLQARLTASDGAAYDQFGYAVALNGGGTIAMVGAAYADVNGNVDRGAAYAFFRDVQGNWSQQAKLTASNGQAGDHFGASVAVSLNTSTALVGADRKDVGLYIDQGVVYIFAHSGGVWTEQSSLYASVSQSNVYFGIAVAIGGSEAGDVALIGAPGEGVGGITDRGSAYIFTRSAGVWGYTATLAATGAADYDQFGMAVALSADSLDALVGAPFDDVGGNSNQGSAYVFRRDTGAWLQTQQLVAADGAAYDYFGWTVARLGGESALVGAYSADISGRADQGAAYLYTRQGITYASPQKLTDPGGGAGDGFGFAVALSGGGGRALVGAWKEDIGTSLDQGGVSLFEFDGDGWVRRAYLTACDGLAGYPFGGAVAMSGDGSTALVAAAGATIDGILGRGAVYVFERDGAGLWRAQQRLTASEGGTVYEFGFSLALSENGNLALLGAPYSSVDGKSYQGAAFIFIRSGGVWSQQARLIAADGAACDFFGNSVAMSANGSTALVGAQNADVSGRVNQGAAYVFKFNGSAWVQAQKLAASDGLAGDTFGSAVALDNDGSDVLVGAMLAAEGGNAYQGAAYMFVWNGALWEQRQRLTLTTSHGAAHDYFGCSVALSSSGFIALVGAVSADAPLVDQGAAYVFVFNGYTWDEQAKLLPADVAAFDAFGSSVALNKWGNIAMIGSPYADIGGVTSQGAVYTFVRNGDSWREQTKVADLVDGRSGDHYGSAVALDGEGATGLVGAVHAHVNSVEQGLAYIYQLPGIPVPQYPWYGLVIDDPTPTFTWLPAANAAGYLLKLNGVVTDVGNVLEYTSPPLAEGVYHWYVAAYDVLGNTGPYYMEGIFTVGLIREIYLPLVTRH